MTGKMSAMCISGRNQYSKGAIQQDFAAGMRELDQELAAEEDEEASTQTLRLGIMMRWPEVCLCLRLFSWVPGTQRATSQGSSCLEVHDCRRDGDPSITGSLRKAY